MRCWIAHSDDLYHTSVLMDDEDPSEYEMEPGLAFESAADIVRYFRLNEPEVTSFGIVPAEMMWLE